MKKVCLQLFSLLLAITFFLPTTLVQAQDLSLTASAAIAMDYDTKEILYAKDIDTLRVPASMTKIMTAYIIYEEIAKGNLEKDTPITISRTAAGMSTNNNYPMAVPLAAGATYTVDELLGLIMVPSASASCFAMAEHISSSEEEFVKRMNQTAKDLNINAEFKNSHGAQVHYITAKGVAELIRVFIKKYPDILNYSSLESVTFRGVRYANTNRLLPGGSYEYTGADGFKTGTIAAAGYCLSATAERNGRRVITVVMNSSSTETRHTDSIKLLDHAFGVIEGSAGQLPSGDEATILFRDTVGHPQGRIISALSSDGIISGYGNGYFMPYKTVTYGEFLSALGRLSEQMGLAADIKTVFAAEGITAPYEPYISWALENKIVSGYGEAFGAGTGLNRENAAAILDKYLSCYGLMFENVSNLVPADLEYVSDWASDAVTNVVSLELIANNDDGNFTPKAGMSRGDVALALRNVQQNSAAATDTDADTAVEVSQEADVAPAEDTSDALQDAALMEDDSQDTATEVN